MFANILITPQKRLNKCISLGDQSQAEEMTLCTQETGRLLSPISVFFFSFSFLCDGQLLWKNLPLIAEDGPEAITQALVTIGVTASPLDLESVRTKKFSLRWLQSHLCVKYIHNKYDLIINELTALLVSLGSPFIWVFFQAPATRSPQHRGELKHLFNPTDPISHPTPQDQACCSELFSC